jgi:hypothetical protein
MPQASSGVLAQRNAKIKEAEDASKPAQTVTKPTTPAPAPKEPWRYKDPKGTYGTGKGEVRVPESDLKEAMKPLGSLKDGTDRVPKTGSYMLHKDEAVLNKKDATRMRDRVSSAMGGSRKKSKTKKKKGGKHVHEMHIRHGASGGYIAKHHFKPGADGMPQEPEEHAIPDMDALQQHVADNMQPGPQPSPQPQPQGPPAGAMPGM